MVPWYRDFSVQQPTDECKGTSQDAVEGDTLPDASKIMPLPDYYIVVPPVALRENYAALPDGDGDVCLQMSW